MNAKSNFLITGLYLSETGQLARKPDRLFFLSSVFIIKKRCVSLWRNRIPLLPKATICCAERQGQIRTPTHEYQEYHEEEPRYTGSDSPRAHTRHRKACRLAETARTESVCLFPEIRSIQTLRYKRFNKQSF